MDYMGRKDRENAIGFYLDLIGLQESPVKILALINTHFTRLYNIKQLMAEGKQGEIASLLKIPPFFVKKYIEQAKNFSSEILKDAIEYGIFADNAIKTGGMNEYVAVESMIVRYSA